MARTYREDIDWLRAIAVLAVLAFHWEIAPFRGGFVGVDVFFVISGFLITRIIQDDLERGTFSFVHFYERRIRRLLPALYVMSVLVIPPAFLYLLPSERANLFKSIAATVTFTSNVFFWLQSGYFAVPANEKPMLHTWSLSVEEQFYLVLPVLIWLLLRRRLPMVRQDATLLFGLGGASVASFALCHWLMTTGRVEAAFFLSPPRAWEFLAGGLISLRGIPALANIHFKRVICVVGLAMIVVPAVGYRDGSFFPGVGALLPCTGAVLFIWSGVTGSAPLRAVCSPLNVAGFIGRISYSLYLWHWPLFLYLRFSQPDLTVSTYQKVLLFAATIAIAYASYCFVEQPFRQRRWIVARQAVFVAAGCTSAVLLLVSAIGFSLSRPLQEAANPLHVYQDSSYPDWYRAGSCFFYRWEDFRDQACLEPALDRPNVLLWGDSLAAQYIHGLNQHLAAEGTHLLQANGAACLATIEVLSDWNERCRNLQKRIGAFFAENRPDAVVIAGKWDMHVEKVGFDEMIAILLRNISMLKSLSIPVVVVGPSPTFRSRLPAMLLRAEATGVELRSDILMVRGLFDLDRRMKESIPSSPGVEYVSILDAVCDGLRCPLILEGKVPLTFDRVHVTADGSVLISAPVASAIRNVWRIRS